MFFRILIIIISTVLLVGCQSEEDKAWEAALAKHSTLAVDSFLMKYPDSKYQSAAAEKKEDFRWYRAKQKNTIYNYKKYLAEYPNGKYTEKVPLYIDSIPKKEIELTALTKSTFVGKINYGDHETQIIAFRFTAIEQNDKGIQFVAKINTSDFRKPLEGRISLKDNSIMFMEDPASKQMINLTDGRIYHQDNKYIIESTNISQYWNLVKYDE